MRKPVPKFDVDADLIEKQIDIVIDIFAGDDSVNNGGFPDDVADSHSGI